MTGAINLSYNRPMAEVRTPTRQDIRAGIRAGLRRDDRESR